MAQAVACILQSKNLLDMALLRPILRVALAPMEVVIPLTTITHLNRWEVGQELVVELELGTTLDLDILISLPMVQLRRPLSKGSFE